MMARTAEAVLTARVPIKVKEAIERRAKQLGVSTSKLVYFELAQPRGLYEEPKLELPPFKPQSK